MANKNKAKTGDKTTAQTAPETAQEKQEATQEAQGTQEAQEGQEAPQPAPDVIVTVDYEAGLNLRDGPHTSYNSLAILQNEAPLVVIPLPAGAEVPGWALVRCMVDGESLVGWVCTDFVRED